MTLVPVPHHNGPSDYPKIPICKKCHERPAVVFCNKCGFPLCQDCRKDHPCNKKGNKKEKSSN